MCGAAAGADRQTMVAYPHRFAPVAKVAPSVS
jgi:hypothetical protein